MNLKAGIDGLDIRCNAEAKQSLYLAGNALGADDFQAEVEARHRVGIHANYLVPSALREQFGLQRDGAIFSHDNLAFNPRKLNAELFRKAHKRKVRFYAPFETTAIKTSRNEVVIEIADGLTIVASHVVLATRYELVADLVPATNYKIISICAIATRLQKQALRPGAARRTDCRQVRAHGAEAEQASAPAQHHTRILLGRLVRHHSHRTALDQ